MKLYSHAMVFTGHMMDAPGRKEPRFPATMHEMVGDALRKSIKYAWLEADNLLFVSGAARGADIMALEIAQALEIDTKIVIPHNIPTFIGNSIGEPNPFCWARRLDKVLEGGRYIVMNGKGEDHDYAKANEHMVQIAQNAAGRMKLLAFWDRKPGGGLGGTEHFVNSFQELGGEVEIIDANAMLQKHLADLGSPVSQHD
jgi:hypothetical protein